MLLKKYIKTISGNDKFFYQMCRVLYLNSDEKNKHSIEIFLKKKSKELSQMKNKEKYLEEATKMKIKLTKDVEKIDFILNDENLLIKEFKKRNKNIDDDKKISTPLILKGMLEKERKIVLDKISDISFILKPANYVKRVKELEEYENVLKCKGNIQEEIIMLETYFLSFIERKLNKVTERNQIIDIIYYFRYYKTIYINKDKCIGDIEELYEKIDSVFKKVIIIACKNSILKIISMDINLNFEIIKYVLNTKIIDLEDIRLLFEADNDTLLINVFDKEIFEKQGKKEIENAKKYLEVRNRRIIKLFN